MIRVSCSSLRATCTVGLIEQIGMLGLEPVVTARLVHATYAGNDRQKANELIELFEREPDHDIYHNGLDV